MKRVLASGSELLFALDQAPLTDFSAVTCFDRTLEPVRLTSLGELVTSVDDPVTYQQIIHVYGLHGSLVGFVIYRDPLAEVTLVVPEGWSLARQPDGRCVARAPQGLPISIQYELLQAEGPAAIKGLNDRILGREHAEFCSQRFIIDPKFSNALARPVIQRGIIAQRRTFALDRRCGPMGLQPGIDRTPAWTQLPEAPQTPPGFFQCQPTACPMTGMGPSFSYPETWEMSGYYNPELIKGWGFASYVVARTRALIGMIHWHQSSAFVKQLQECTWQLSNSESCERIYALQNLWASGVVAATASSISR